MLTGIEQRKSPMTISRERRREKGIQDVYTTLDRDTIQKLDEAVKSMKDAGPVRNRASLIARLIKFAIAQGGLDEGASTTNAA